MLKLRDQAYHICWRTISLIPGDAISFDRYRIYVYNLALFAA